MAAPVMIGLAFPRLEKLSLENITLWMHLQLVCFPRWQGQEEGGYIRSCCEKRVCKAKETAKSKSIITRFYAYWFAPSAEGDVHSGGAVLEHFTFCFVSSC